MSLVVTGSAIALWAAALVSAVTAGAALRLRTRTPGGTQFSVMMAGILVWCLMAGMEAAAVGLQAKLLFTNLGYFGVCAVSPLFVWFSLVYSGKGGFLTPPRAALLWAIPAATLLLAFTNSWHHILWTGFTVAPSGNMLLYAHGPWFWVWVFYAAAATCAGTALLMQSALGCERFFLRQVLIFLTGAAMPWIGAVIYLSPRNPFPGLDFPSIGFACAGGILLLGMSKFRLFDIVPVARRDLVEQMREGLIVLDSANRVVDINPAAGRILGVGVDAIGQPADKALAALTDFLPAAGVLEAELTTRISLPGETAQVVDMVVSLLKRTNGADSRVIFLRGAVAEEMVPICASCKRVRVAPDTWQGLEQYVEERTAIRFSHGLCHDCIGRLYPELDIDKNPSGS